MHRSAVSNAAVLLHSDDDVNLHYHCNAFISFISVLDLPNFKEHIFERTPLSDCFQI